MFNGFIIYELLKAQGKLGKDLLDFLGIDSSKNSVSQIVKANPSAERVEKIADFFNVSIDSLFIRENPDNKDFEPGSVPIIQNNNTGTRYKVISTINLKNDIKHLQQMVCVLKERISDKEEIIKKQDMLIKKLQKSE